MPPKLNQKRALFVLSKIDEILAWERCKEAEKDTRFVELGRYLCEVRAGQYWRLETLKSFDEFLERRFPESRRKAYYLMSIHEHLPPEAKRELKQVGWSKGLELAKLARSRDGQEFDCATWLHKAKVLPKEEFRREVEKELTGRDSEAWEIIYFKLYKSQIPSRAHARQRQIPRLLSGNDLRGFSGRREPGQRATGGVAAFAFAFLSVPPRRAEARICAVREWENSMNQFLQKQMPIRVGTRDYGDLRERILRRDGWRCQFCGTMASLEVHHQQFRSHSGEGTEDNLITLCTNCHSSIHT